MALPKKDTQETILLLLNELLLMNCICIAQHEQMKTALMQEYLLNQLQLKQIIGLQGNNQLKAIYEFIDYNGDFQIKEIQTKYLLSYLRVPEYQLEDEHSISSLFIPTSIKSSNVTTQKGDSYSYSTYLQQQKAKMHSNYDKKYLTRQDLCTNPKQTFLNYVHPNSYKMPQVPTKEHVVHKQVLNDYLFDDSVGNQHEGIDLVHLNRNQHSMKNLKQKKHVEIEKQPQLLRPIEESQMKMSNMYGSQSPAIKLVEASHVPINTPVLEQFMHESNIMRNLGQYHIPEHHNNINNHLQDSSSYSHLSNSEAFQRLEHHHSPQNYDPFKKKTQNNAYQLKVNEQPREMKRSREVDRFQPQRELQKQKRMEFSQMQSSGGVLSQFIRHDVR